MNNRQAHSPPQPPPRPQVDEPPRREADPEQLLGAIILLVLALVGFFAAAGLRL